MATAVFDLDGTLLNADSTARWLRDLIEASPLRFVAAGLALPVAGPMLISRSQRGLGASTFLWLATAGMDAAALQRSLDHFGDRFRDGAYGLSWRKPGIAALERHLGEGHRVVVVTAAPTLVAEQLLRPWLPHVSVLGTSLKRAAGGWVCERLCLGEQKCCALREAGYPESWEFAYSDSDDDRPLLARAARGFLVQGSPKVLARMRAAGLISVEAIEW